MQTQLQIFSSFSLLKSPTQIDNLVVAAKERGYQSLALTDINNMYGSVDFYKAAKKQNIKPIIGLTAEVGGLINTDKQYRLVLLAKNHSGYQNLLKLSSSILLDEEHASFDKISDYLNDIFVITSANKSEILDLNETDIKKYFTQLASYTDKDNIFIGISSSLRTNLTQQMQLADKFQIPTAFVENIAYINSDQAFATKILEMIDVGDTFDNPLEFSQRQGDFYLRNSEEFDNIYQELNLLDTLDNTQRIAEECNVEIEFKRAELPKFKTPNDESSVDYLQALVVADLKHRFDNDVPKEYQQRALHELKIINEMGFSDYFLIVWDVIRHAHEKHILTGPGRGSAAGSLVSYALHITDIDPLKYNLLFERFLNPERVSMPDIDLDIPDNRRDELVLYMQEKYGDKHMAQIITFGTLAAKMALRDVGRVFSQNQFDMNKWSNAIPVGLKVSLKTAYNESPKFKELVNQNEVNKLLYDTALKIEGLPRHFSTHAAGIVLGKNDLTDTIALRMGSDGIALTQQTKDNVESLGLLKMDFLGLRNLTILDNAIKNVTKQVGKKLLTEKINLNDEMTLQLFQRGDTDGVFQFESSGIRNVLRKIKPMTFDDVVATNALYRPGPMQNIDSFAARKNHEEPVTYPDESLKNILQSTYGILVYQEQVMQVASTMAGFTLAEADSLRRAMAKKHKNEIDELRNKFISGAIAKGHDQSSAITVYDYIEKFANYGFNKSHSVAYSKVAFWLAYIKVHFASAFFTAVLNSNIQDASKVKKYIQDAKSRKITIVAPNINQSGYVFENSNKQIIFGLTCIKGVRREFAKNILLARQEGKFTSVLNFLQRIDLKFVKNDNVEPLILSGAFDEFNNNRKELLYDTRDLIESIQLSGNNVSLFDVLNPKKNDVDDYEDFEKLDQEIMYLGTYVSRHPVERYRNDQLSYISNLNENIKSKIVGYIKNIRTIRTKKGDQMAFVNVEDESTDISLTIFPEAFKKAQELLVEGDVIYATGKLGRDKRSQLNFVVDEVTRPTKNLTLDNTLFLRVLEELDSDTSRLELAKLLEQYPGNKKTIVFYPKTDKKILYKVNYSPELKAKLVKKLGIRNIIER